MSFTDEQVKFSDEQSRINDFENLYAIYCKALDPNVKEWLKENGFFSAPASTKYHGAYAGGLYDHSRAVFWRLYRLTIDNKLEWQRPESPFIVGMFHDLCKYDQYSPDWVPL